MIPSSTLTGSFFGCCHLWGNEVTTNSVVKISIHQEKITMFEEFVKHTVAEDPEPTLVDHEYAWFEMPFLAVAVDNLVSITVRGVDAVIEELIQGPSNV